MHHEAEKPEKSEQLIDLSRCVEIESTPRCQRVLAGICKGKHRSKHTTQRIQHDNRIPDYVGYSLQILRHLAERVFQRTRPIKSTPASFEAGVDLSHLQCEGFMYFLAAKNTAETHSERTEVSAGSRRMRCKVTAFRSDCRVAALHAKTWYSRSGSS